MVFVSRPKLQGLLSFPAPPPEHPGQLARRLFLNFRVCVFLKSAVSFPALRLFDQKDLCFDVLLCDVNFSRFSSQVFFFFSPFSETWQLDSQGEIVPIIELSNPDETQI